MKKTGILFVARTESLYKNLEDAKEAVNQPFAYEKEFQTKLARLNELNTVLNQEGGRTDMHPEIQALLTKIDQTYTAMVTDPQKYLDYLTFRGQCVGMGAENSVAVFAQNPKATYCPAPEALGSPNVKSGEEDHFVSVLRSDGIERVYALEQYDLPESEYLDNAPLQWTDAQHGDLMHRVEDAAHLADIPSAIIGNTGSVNSGDSSEYFNETARGLITGLVLLVSQYGQDGERHIVSVFNLIVELAGADNPEKGNTVQKSRLAAMLEGVTDRRIKGYISTTTSADIRTTLNIVSSALSKLLKFVDAELEQLICTHDNDLDAEQFIERPTAIFLIAPDENETRHFLASLFVRFLTDDLIALAERQGGHCPRPFYYFLDEFGNFPAIPGVTSLFSAIRSRGGRILVAVQSYSQFLLKYDKNVTEIIKDNCQILLNTFVSPSAQDTATSISKMLGDETILTGSSSRSDGKTTSSHQLMGRPLMSPAQMVRIQRDTWIVEKAGYAPMKTHLEGYWKYLSLAPQEQDSTGENDYLEIKLLSTESLRQALGSAPACPHTPPAATREPRRKLGASRREAAALYPGKFNP